MNKFRLPEIQVIESNPYSEDLLGRNRSGEILQELVQSFSNGFVMALNGKWGSGKTTFVRMWQQQMKNDGYTTIYYNSWENDYISDPLISLIAEFKKTIEIPGEKPLKKFVNAFRKVSEAMVPSFLALAAKKLTGLDLKELEKAIEKGTEEAIDIIDNSVDNYIEQQKSIKSFRDALTDFVGLLSPQKPVIFIIDELDRCKPDFAVKTLERIKHLFSVKNVVFVFAIDREQLSHSIRGYYGSDLIDAEDYLRRFIDIQYDLPVGTIGDIIDNVIKDLDYDNSILSKRSFPGFDHEIEYFFDFIRSFCVHKNLSIRQIEKWLLHTRFIINHLDKLNVSPLTLSFLVYLHDFDIVFYNHLLHAEFSDQETLNRLAQYFSQSYISLNNTFSNSAYEVIAELLSMRYSGNDVLFYQKIKDRSGNILLKLDNEVDEERLSNAFHSSYFFSLPPFDLINQWICDISSIDK